MTGSTYMRKVRISEKLKRLLGKTQRPAPLARVEHFIALVERESHESYE